MSQGRSVPTAPPFVSVVVVSYNSAPCLAACFESVFRQGYPRFEVVCVDNASSDDSWERIQRDSRVRGVRSDRNLGFAGGCNLAVRHAQGDVIVLLNPDTEVEPNWLSALVACLDDPTIAIAGSKILSADGTKILAAGGCYESNGLSHHYREGDPDDSADAGPQDVAYVTGASLAVRRSVYEHLGGLHEGYFPAYFEEIELCRRVRERHLRVVYVPASRCRHLESRSVGAGTSNFFYWYHRNRLRFVLRNACWSELILKALPHELAWLAKNGVVAAARSLRHRPTWRFWRAVPDYVSLRAYGYVLARAPAIRLGRKSSPIATSTEGKHGTLHRHRRGGLHRSQSDAPAPATRA